VVALAKEAGITVLEPLITQYDVYTADEVFLTGTAAEVIPAVLIDGRTIGSGKPGPVTRQLIDAFRAHTATAGILVQ